MYRKARLLEFRKGFAQDIFNISTKYNAINIWHGLVPGRFNRLINPLQYIKRILISKNLSTDLEAGRARNCSFAKIYLSNVFLYQKTYHIVEPFNQANCFRSPEGRYRYIKALLHPCSYIEECPLCRQGHKDTCEHFLTSCSQTVDAKRKLLLKLTLYNYPHKATLKKADILVHTLENRVWRKCFTDFLTESDFQCIKLYFFVKHRSSINRQSRYFTTPLPLRSLERTLVCLKYFDLTFLKLHAERPGKE